MRGASLRNRNPVAAVFLYNIPQPLGFSGSAAGKNKEACMACAFDRDFTRAAGAEGALIGNANNRDPRNAAVAAADKLPFPQA